MPKIKFTAAKIRSIKPEDKPVEYFQQGRTPGTGSFCFRVTPKGARSWYLYYLNDDQKLQRFRLGSYPDISLADAEIKFLIESASFCKTLVAVFLIFFAKFNFTCVNH